jgi:membrane-bound metal-dependent hydrolase YbcI (DUF457 family)
MALCFVHTAAGYLAYEAVRPADEHRGGLLAAAVVLANGPDIDFLPGLLIGQPGAFHRGFTHTLGAAVLVGMTIWLVSRLMGRRARSTWRVSCWATAVYASHLLVDFVTMDSHPPYGARFLWPLSDSYYLAPVTPLREIIIDPSGRLAFLRSLVQPHTLGVWAEEIGVLLAVVALVHAARALWTALGAVAEGLPDRP